MSGKDAAERAHAIVRSQGGSYAASQWDESKHPRVPGGLAAGGQFTAAFEPAAHGTWSAVHADPAYLYHATSVDRLHEIAGGGLHTHGPSYGTDQSVWPDGSRERRSYFSHSPATAYAFAPAEGRAVLTRISRTAAAFKRESTGDFYARQKIAAAHIEALDNTGHWVAIGR